MEGAIAVDEGFWRKKTLEEMSPEEWEALCDGCGRCCLLKLQDVFDGAVAYTRIACRLFDDGACRCTAYALRSRLVPGCVGLTPQTIRETADWMPASCAYRLVAEGRELPAWHPLRTGDPESVHDAGVSVRGWTVPEYEVHEDDYEDFVLPDLMHRRAACEDA